MRRPQASRVGSNTSSTITLNTGAPQGRVLSPLLFALLNAYISNLCIKVTDNTIAVGLINSKDETIYRGTVSCARTTISTSMWRRLKKMVVDFKRQHAQHPPLTINGVAVEQVNSVKFLGVHDLSWTPHHWPHAQQQL